MAILISSTFADPVPEILQQYADIPLGLARARSCDQRAAQRLASSAPASLFPNARNADAALSGLLLLLGCWEECHEIAQDIPTPEGSYWHGIAHRIEPDTWNSNYWFRRVGSHPIFPSLHSRAGEILSTADGMSWKLKSAWDPFLFNEWCDQARSHPGSPEEQVALAIQKAEWELLFAWCAANA